MQDGYSPRIKALAGVLHLPLVFGMIGSSCGRPDADETRPPDVAEAAGRVDRPTTAQAALTALKQGNARFVRGELRHPHTAARYRAELGAGQHPFATVIGCSDSRVPPELLFDEGFGDLFVIRVAGNVNDTDVSASVEYGVEHLGTPLVVVMGHEHCGAVTAAVQHLRGELSEGKEPPEILSLVRRIEPGLVSIAPEGPLADIVHGAVEDNVQHTMQELLDVPAIARAVDEGRLSIVGAIYDLDSGHVRYLDPVESPSDRNVD